MNTGFSWSDVAVPLSVLAFAVIATLWLRQAAFRALERWAEKNRWQGDEMTLQATRGPSVLWCLVVSAGLALAVSSAPSAWKGPAGKGLWSILIFSLALTALNLAGRFIPFYGERWKWPQRALVLSRNTARAVIFLLAVLVALDVWGVPTTPILLVIALAALAALLALRGSLADLFAGFQLSATGRIRVGDYVRLESGEEGCITEMDWRSTRIRALDDSVTIVPNSKLVHSTVTNYGHPLKKAREPFRFYSRDHLKEPTGLRAKNLQELVDIMKTVPDSVIYYHTHQFLEEHHFLTPGPASEFALWVRDTLGDEVLGEKLAAIDTFEFSTLGALRERLVSIIEGHLSLEAGHGSGHRDAAEGSEFHFMESRSVVSPTPYVAHDLREFVEVLRKLSLGSLYFHIFESRLRLGRGLNDFSVWLEDSLGEKELAEQIAHLDPHNYTLEGLRSLLIQLIEKRIK